MGRKGNFRFTYGGWGYNFGKREEGGYFFLANIYPWMIIQLTFKEIMNV